MEEQKKMKYMARCYCLSNGRLATTIQMMYNADIKNVYISPNCLFVEVCTFDEIAKKAGDKSAVKVDPYLVGDRFDKCRAHFVDEREKTNFTLFKVYKPHTLLAEKDIKNGKYCPQSQSVGENE